MSAMPTRDRILDAAERLFAERGGADGADSAQANTFALTVKQGSPRSDDEEAGQ